MPVAGHRVGGGVDQRRSGPQRRLGIGSRRLRTTAGRRIEHDLSPGKLGGHAFHLGGIGETAAHHDPGKRQRGGAPRKLFGCRKMASVRSRPIFSGEMAKAATNSMSPTPSPSSTGVRTPTRLPVARYSAIPCTSAEILLPVPITATLAASIM